MKEISDIRGLNWGDQGVSNYHAQPSGSGLRQKKLFWVIKEKKQIRGCRCLVTAWASGSKPRKICPSSYWYALSYNNSWGWACSKAADAGRAHLICARMLTYAPAHEYSFLCLSISKNQVSLWVNVNFLTCLAAGEGEWCHKYETTMGGTYAMSFQFYNWECYEH